MQLMSREDDSAPIILETGIRVVSLKWNDNGSILAVAGFETSGDKTHNLVYFYSPWGEVRVHGIVSIMNVQLVSPSICAR